MLYIRFGSGRKKGISHHAIKDGSAFGRCSFFQMKHFLFFILLLSQNVMQGQELFVYTEPASNVPAKSLGIRLTQQIATRRPANAVSYQLIPELVLGASNKLMLHGEAFLNTRNGQLIPEGGSLYIKYRFHSSDEVHRHFRMAVFGNLSYSSGIIVQPAIDFSGMNTGASIGLIGTRLIDRLALSTSLSFMHALNNGTGDYKKVQSADRDAIAYSLSAGRLILPFEYKDYDQLNFNLMIELLGQTKIADGATFVDLAPSLQCIVRSRMRIDLGYRFPLVSQLYRMAANGVLIRLEYNLFNAIR